MIRIPQERADQAMRLVPLIGREPFQKRAWAELAFFLVSSALCGVGVFAFTAIGALGLLLTVVIVGVFILAGGLRLARGFGGWQRLLAQQMIGETIPEPEAFNPRPGLFAWFRASLGDRSAWRSAGYLVAENSAHALRGLVCPQHLDRGDLRDPLAHRRRQSVGENRPVRTDRRASFRRRW